MRECGELAVKDLRGKSALLRETVRVVQRPPQTWIMSWTVTVPWLMVAEIEEVECTGHHFSSNDSVSKVAAAATKEDIEPTHKKPLMTYPATMH